MINRIVFRAIAFLILVGIIVDASKTNGLQWVSILGAVMAAFFWEIGELFK